MLQTMRSVYEFDNVHDGQRVFRALLEAMANPGRMCDIAAEAGRFVGDEGGLLAIGCTLLDNEETMYVEKNRQLAETLHSLTLCREDALESADFIFLSSELNRGSIEQIFQRAKHGTYADPQTSATVILYTPDLEGEVVMTLSGPGVDGERSIWTTAYVKTVAVCLNSLALEYPLGIDLLFCDAKGRVLAVPRLMKVQ